VPLIKGNHQSRIQFVKKLARILPFDIPQSEQDMEEESEAITKEVLGDCRTVEEQSLDVENFKLLLKNIFFSSILKKESDFAKVWDAINTSKLVDKTIKFASSMQNYFCEKNKAE
jgi:hypothetical protein